MKREEILNSLQYPICTDIVAAGELEVLVDTFNRFGFFGVDSSEWSCIQKERGVRVEYSSNYFILDRFSSDLSDRENAKRFVDLNGDCNDVALFDPQTLFQRGFLLLTTRKLDIFEYVERLYNSLRLLVGVYPVIILFDRSKAHVGNSMELRGKSLSDFRDKLLDEGSLPYDEPYDEPRQEYFVPASAIAGVISLSAEEVSFPFFILGDRLMRRVYSALMRWEFDGQFRSRVKANFSFRLLAA